MTPTALLLADLNFRREAVGQKALKSWKASRQALEDAIAKLPPAMPTITPDDDPTGATADPADVTITSVGSEPKTVRRQPKRDDATRLTVIARFNGKREKVLRAKARRWQSKLRQYTVDPTVEDWTFWNKDLDAVCKILGVNVPSMQDGEPTEETKLT